MVICSSSPISRPKFQAPSSNTFWDILLPRFHSDFCQSGITPESQITRTRKKIWVSYFSMRNPYMKFQNPSMDVFDERIHRLTHGQPETNMLPQLLRSWWHKNVNIMKELPGILGLNELHDEKFCFWHMQTALVNTDQHLDCLLPS